MEIDAALRGFSVEVRRCSVDTKRHGALPNELNGRQLLGWA
jgi:hypothetical protein